MCNEYNSLLKEDELILSDEIKGKTVITLGTDIDDIEIHIMRDAYDGEWKNAYKKTRKRLLKLLEDIRDKETDYYKDETVIYAGISAIVDRIGYVVENNGIDGDE